MRRRVCLSGGSGYLTAACGCGSPAASLTRNVSRKERAMKTMGLALLLSGGTLFADSSNTAVMIAGQQRTTTDIEQMVIIHAHRAGMLFDFTGVHLWLKAQSNGTIVVSIWCAQTNETYFYATVDKKGAIRAQELGVRDAQAIRTLLSHETTDAVTQVWLGPDGRVGAWTSSYDKDHGESFWLRRTGARWTIESRGTWKTMPPFIFPAPDHPPTDPRHLRIEYPSAMYHPCPAGAWARSRRGMMNRGDQRQDIFN